MKYLIHVSLCLCLALLSIVSQGYAQGHTLYAVSAGVDTAGAGGGASFRLKPNLMYPVIGLTKDYNYKVTFGISFDGMTAPYSEERFYVKRGGGRSENDIAVFNVTESHTDEGYIVLAGEISSKATLGNVYCAVVWTEKNGAQYTVAQTIGTLHQNRVELRINKSGLASKMKESTHPFTQQRPGTYSFFLWSGDMQITCEIIESIN